MLLLSSFLDKCDSECVLLLAEVTVASGDVTLAAAGMCTKWQITQAVLHSKVYYYYPGVCTSTVNKHSPAASFMEFAHMKWRSLLPDLITELTQKQAELTPRVKKKEKLLPQAEAALAQAECNVPRVRPWLPAWYCDARGTAHFDCYRLAFDVLHFDVCCLLGPPARTTPL